jgi:hypothetical protein
MLIRLQTSLIQGLSQNAFGKRQSGRIVMPLSRSVSCTNFTKPFPLLLGFMWSMIILLHQQRQMSFLLQFCHLL